MHQKQKTEYLLHAQPFVMIRGMVLSSLQWICYYKRGCSTMICTKMLACVWYLDVLRVPR